MTSTLVAAPDETQRWRWKMNVDALLDQIENVTAFEADASLQCAAPTHVIRGGASEFVRDEDVTRMRSRFPKLNTSFKVRQPFIS